jgi:hypothetical protein
MEIHIPFPAPTPEPALSTITVPLHHKCACSPNRQAFGVTPRLRPLCGILCTPQPTIHTNSLPHVLQMDDTLILDPQHPRHGALSIIEPRLLHLHPAPFQSPQRKGTTAGGHRQFITLRFQIIRFQSCLPSTCLSFHVHYPLTIFPIALFYYRKNLVLHRLNYTHLHITYPTSTHIHYPSLSFIVPLVVATVHIPSLLLHCTPGNEIALLREST